jgi:hypothetical protein
MRRHADNTALPGGPIGPTDPRDGFVMSEAWWHGAVWYVVPLTLVALITLPRVFKAPIRG